MFGEHVFVEITSLNCRIVIHEVGHGPLTVQVRIPLSLII